MDRRRTSPPIRASRTDWRRELERGACLLRSGDHAGAHCSFARAHALAPDEAAPALALGRQEWRRGHLREAERLLRLAHTARPNWALGAAALARVLIEKNAPGEAFSLLEVALVSSPRSAALLVVRGELALVQDRPAAARDAFLAARAAGAPFETVERGLARAENAAGIALAAAKMPTQAAFAFKRAADHDPDWAPPHVNLGAVLHRLRRWTRAGRQYRRALELDPESPIAHFNLGLLLRDRDDLAGATLAFSAALQAQPPHPEARRELALVLAARRQYAAAAELFEEELRAGRADAVTWANLGLALDHAGDAERAEGAFRHALELDARQPTALAHLAKLCARQGRYIEAVTLYRLARTNLPSRD